MTSRGSLREENGVSICFSMQLVLRKTVGSLQVAHKHDFTGGPYGNACRSLRDCADEFDDGTSTSTSTLTTVSSSSSLANDGKAKSDFVRASTPALGLATVEEPEPVIWRRIFPSNGGSQRAHVSESQNRAKEKVKGNYLS